MSPRKKRFAVAAVIAGLIALAAPTVGALVIDIPYEASFTGCLRPNGTIIKVKQGPDPLQACDDNEKEIHVSGGDITAVKKGTGLSGGAITAEATLSIAQSYRLPQGCGNPSVARWNGSTWVCSTDFGGTHGSTIGLGDVVAAGPTEDCIDGSVFTGVTEVSANTKNLTFNLPAGKWRSGTTGDTRWYMNKTKDLYDGETFAKGFVKLEIVKVTGGAEAVVSTWARAEAENLDGGGLPYNQDFRSFTTDGSSQIYLRATANGGACTTARVLSPSVEFERVG